MNLKIYINKLANELFVQKDVNSNDPQVIAALITAASEMSKYSEITSPEEVIEALSKIYDVIGFKEIEDMIGALGPQFVKTIIGFPVNFVNFAQAQMAYIASNEKYNDLYQSIKAYLILNNQRKF